MKRALRFLLLFAFCSGAFPAGAQQRSISAPQVVSEKRINRTIFEYVMQASLTNGGSAMARNVVATVTSTSPRTTIIQNTLHFGDVAAGVTSPSQDTFTIRHDRTVPFDPAVLRWTITAVPADPVVSAPPSPTMLSTTSVAGMADPNVTIEIVGGTSTVTGTSGASGAFTLNVPLQANKLNNLFVAAIGADGQRSAVVPVAVVQDSQPPSLFIDFPAANAELTNDSVVVSGRVGDMLSGYQGLTVNVDGQPATVNVGIGNNGTFERSVPLVLGNNTIGVIATDINGNTVTKQVTFRRITPVGPRMLQVSGDMQSAQMHGRLPQPIVVRIVNADGSSFAGKLATFTVTLSDGRLVADPGAAGPGTMVLQVPTDGNGVAKAWWNVGADAGRANNRVAVTSEDIAGTAFFCASADPGPPHQINIGTGNNQKGEAGAPTAEPLRAWVNDMCNGIANLPVTFTVKQGGGKLNGQDNVTINTSITGHAQVAFTLGPDAGNNVVEANYPNNPNLPATFIATGIVRDMTRPTSFTGLVLDNTSQPVGGAFCELTISGATLTTTTDAQGRFTFANIAGSGASKLFVDGTPATLLGGQTIPQGSYPFLMYHQVVVANAENSLPTPVLLPRLNPNNAKIYDGTQDVVLTCEGMAGLQMVIKAGSMRRADGSIPTPQDPQIVSLNQVHADSVPMPIPDGASPPFTWTLQPAMATFDPPVQIQYPNMSGLPAGAVAYFLSFNHDTEKFEIIATGHVSADGGVITTDPGAGINVAGWGCNCPPYSVTGDCKRCKEEPASGNAAQADDDCKLCQDGPVPSGASSYTITPLRDDAKIFFFGPRPVTYCGLTLPGGYGGERLDHLYLGAFCDRQAGVWRLRVDEAAISLIYGEVESFPQLEIEDVPKADCSRLQTIRQWLQVVKGGKCPRNDIGNGVRIGDMVTNHEVVHVRHNTEFLNGRGAMYLAELNSLTLPIDDAETSIEAQTQITESANYKKIDQAFQTAFDEFNKREVNHENAPTEFLVAIEDELKKFEDAVEKRSAELGCPARPAKQGLSPVDPSDLEPHPVIPRLLPPPTFFSLEQIYKDAWSFSVNGQQVRAAFSSQLELRNISSPDAFGAAGPGSPPDFVADDYVRVIGQSTFGGVNRYAFSDFFKIRQGQTISLNELTFTDTPPKKPEILAAIPDQATLTALNQTTQVRVTATYADQTAGDVTPATSWTSYRVSNPAIVTVDANGLVTARGAGAAYVTAVNEGTTCVAAVYVTPGTATTTVEGFVRRMDQSWVAGATVSVSGFATGSSDGNGHFSIANVPSGFGPLTVSAQIVEGGVRLVGTATQLAPVPGGITDAGIIILRPAAVRTKTAISAHQDYTVALKTNGSLWAWGHNNFGQLGNGTTSDARIPTRAGTDSDWAQLSSGFGHAVALKSNGSLWAWGYNFYGQLGDGNTVNRHVPVRIGAESDWGEIIAGAYHTVAIKADGSLWSWGFNGPRSPVRVGTDNDWARVDAGNMYTMGVKSDGSLWGWGNNDFGSLGDGTTTDRPDPIRIGSGNDWVAVACGNLHTVGLKTDGSLWAWGYNFYGQVGDGTTTNKLSPTRIGSASDWGQIAAGFSHTLGLKVAGLLWAWGDNRFGELGDGTTVSQLSPIAIGTNQDWAQMAAGREYTIGRKTDGSLWAWGFNFYGQLGDGTTINRLSPTRIGTDNDWGSPGTAIMTPRGPGTDSDGDGIPDTFESANGLNPSDLSDASGDLDGDGQSNLQEYLAGTNPRDASSFLGIEGLARTEASFKFWFPSTVGKRYRVEFTDDLTSGRWEVLVDEIAGTGEPIVITDPQAGEFERGFYRIQVIP